MIFQYGSEQILIQRISIGFEAILEKCLICTCNFLLIYRKSLQAFSKLLKQFCPLRDQSVLCSLQTFLFFFQCWDCGLTFCEDLQLCRGFCEHLFQHGLTQLVEKLASLLKKKIRRDIIQIGMLIRFQSTIGSQGLFKLSTNTILIYLRDNFVHHYRFYIWIWCSSR